MQPTSLEEHAKRKAREGQGSNYNQKEIRDFLRVVFGEHLGNIACWVTKQRPGWPCSADAMYAQLTRLHNQEGGERALYFGTSTLALTPAGEEFSSLPVPPAGDEEKPKPKPSPGVLRNRLEAFQALHVVVLDDIGTKVPWEDLPEALREPTYIIETSPGNFQYGYVLREPVTERDAARALIQIIYDTGLTDAGGAMPTKIVRLPSGVNGKPKHGDFAVTLLRLDEEKKFTPEELLRAVDSDVSWSSVVEDAVEAMRRRKAASGTTEWTDAEMAATDGLIDPMLEWLQKEKRILQDREEWVDIECPWADEHTDGNRSAGYSPLGRGGPAYRLSRGFKCFHEHCKERRTKEFLAVMAAQGAPEVPTSEQFSAKLRQWAHYPPGNGAIQVFGKNPYDGHISFAAFARMHSRKVSVVQSDGKTRSITETALWAASDHRIDVWGTTIDPTTTAKLVDTPMGLMANRYRSPGFTDGEIDTQDEKRWLEFIEYLIPDAKEREYFLDWVAMKIVNPAFRGAGIVMATTTQGTGRGTLVKMLNTLLHPSNTARVRFAQIAEENGFNEWQGKLLVVCDEVMDTPQRLNRYRVYERVKEVIDPMPKAVEINTKYAPKKIVMDYSSYLLFSNHMEALAIAGEDRRLYAISNTEIAKTGAYFTRLHKWIDEGSWAQSVYRWALERVESGDMAHLNDPPPVTQTKEDMIEEAKSHLDKAVDSMMTVWKGRFISLTLIERVLDANKDRLSINGDTLRQSLRHSVRRYAVGGNKNTKVNPIPNSAERSRIFITKKALAEEPSLDRWRKGEVPGPSKSEIEAELHQNIHETLVTAALESVD